MKLYMFRTVPLFLRMELCSILTLLLETCLETCMTYNIAECTVTLDDGQRNCPKHVEFHFKNKFEKLLHLLDSIIRKFVTMYGHMNVKCKNGVTLTRLFLLCLYG
jgi:hypothetical protein